MEKGIDPLETRKAMAVEILTAEKLIEEFQKEKLPGQEAISREAAPQDIEKLPEVTEASKADPDHREEAELIRIPEEA